MDRSGDGRVVATAVPPRGSLLSVFVLWPSMTVVWGAAAIVLHEGIYAALAVAAAVVSLLGVALWFGGPNAQLCLTPDSIELRRRVWSYSARARTAGCRTPRRA